MKVIPFLFFLLFNCLIHINTEAQTNNSTFGSAHTPQGNLHVLVLFIGFNDETDANDVPGWPHNQIPVWATGADNILFNSTAANIGNIDNLSKFYKTMYFGQFTVTGEIFPEQIMINRVMSGTDLHWELSGQAVANWLTDHFPSYDWSKFDNRDNGSNWQTDNSNSTPDNELDYFVTFKS